MERPPSTTRIWPVTNGEPSKYITVRTMSSAVPVRASGARRMKVSAISGASSGNEIVPGAMAFTVTSGLGPELGIESA